MTKKEIGEGIKKFRVNAGLSQKELGKILNKSHAAISDLERGKTDLSVEDLLTIAERLNTPIGYILNIQMSPINYVIQYNGRAVRNVKSEKSNINITGQNSMIL